MMVILGWISSCLPPFLGIWLFYSWWAERDEWVYQRKLLRWFEEKSRKPALELSDYVKWDTPYGRLVLFRRENGVGLFTKDDCIMVGFHVGPIETRVYRRLLAAVNESIGVV